MNTEAQDLWERATAAEVNIVCGHTAGRKAAWGVIDIALTAARAEGRKKGIEELARILSYKGIRIDTSFILGSEPKRIENAATREAARRGWEETMKPSEKMFLEELETRLNELGEE